MVNETQEMASENFKTALLALVPDLRAFGSSLSGDSHKADDLVQETLVKAWKHHASFTEGTNLRAWLFTILRNEFYSMIRKRKREVEDIDGMYCSKLSVPGGQVSHLELNELRAALAQLPEDQREAILLVGAIGLSYEEAAGVCGTAVGTIKSRVNRARKHLAFLLNADENTN